jgi:hypothetical protein
MVEANSVEAAQRGQGEARRSGVIHVRFAAFTFVFAGQISSSHEKFTRLYLCSLFSDTT